MNALALEARGLAKRFGPVTALHPLDLALPRGRVLAVLGANGAGKTTLLRLLAGLARPSAGSVAVGGDAADRRARRARVGLVAHATALYPALSARENLAFAGRLHGVPEPEARADALLARFELDAVAGRRAGTFSRGTAQRVAIARALVHEPDVLLLDEPFTGLDARAADLLEGLVRELGAQRSVVLSSHDLARVARLADEGLLLDAGHARALAPAALRDPDALARALAGMPP
ncbi:MAG TPA: ABC transporter ATP-binding protein [Myxococcota bacterium]|nr:ABC transporter ATP-binding protein [Myxococcota bacterium]